MILKQYQLTLRLRHQKMVGYLSLYNDFSSDLSVGEKKIPTRVEPYLTELRQPLTFRRRKITRHRDPYTGGQLIKYQVSLLKWSPVWSLQCRVRKNQFYRYKLTVTAAGTQWRPRWQRWSGM